MKRKNLALHMMLLALLILVAGCAMQAAQQQAAPQAFLSLETDKQLYHSGEIMNISISVLSTYAGEGSLRVQGISTASGYKLDTLQQVVLAPGTNSFQVIHTTPSCNRCSGIPEGNYSISAYLVSNATANATVTVEIKQ